MNRFLATATVVFGMVALTMGSAVANPGQGQGQGQGVAQIEATDQPVVVDPAQAMD